MSSILNNIIESKDLFFCFAQFISYNEWISLSCLDKNIHHQIKLYRKENPLLDQTFQQSFLSYPSQIISLAPYDKFLNLWDRKKLFSIDKYYSKELFFEKNAHVSDILQFFSQIFLIDENYIYATYYLNDYFLPKKIIQKYGISKYETYPYFNAFVNIKLEHFDLERIQTISIDSILYVKIWNHHLQSDIIIYLFHPFNETPPNKEWIVKETQSKIEQIIYYHRFHDPRYESDPFFTEQGDIRIFTTSKHTFTSSLTGWFLE